MKSKSLAFENMVLLSLIRSGLKWKRSFMPKVSDGAVPDAMLSMQMRRDPHKPLEASLLISRDSKCDFGRDTEKLL